MRTTESIDIRFPKSLQEALQLQANAKTRGTLLAGGTDLMVQWAAGVPTPERATSLWNLPELSSIELFPDWVEIGAGVTHAFLRDCKEIQRHLPALIAAAKTVGAAQFRLGAPWAGMPPMPRLPGIPPRLCWYPAAPFCWPRSQASAKCH